MKQISLILIALLIGTTMQAKEAYAVLSENNTMLTFYYDDQKESRGGMDITFSSFTDNPWLSASNYGIETVIFDASMDNCYAITSTADWFYNCRKLKTITGLEYFHTSEVTDMREMFYCCSALTNLDLSTLNTAKVTNMDFMFRDCRELESLNLSSFNTSNVTSMSYMFTNCTDLETIYVGSGWSTEKVNNQSGDIWMFLCCYSIAGGQGTTYNDFNYELEYAHVDGGVNNPGYLTAVGTEAPSLPYVTISEDHTVLTFYYDKNKKARNGKIVWSTVSSGYCPWDSYREELKKVIFDDSYSQYTRQERMASWFSDCTQLESIDLRNLKTDNTTTMSYMFAKCKSLPSLDLSTLNTENLTEMRGMFIGCEALNSLKLDNFNISKVKFLDSAFYGCKSLTTLDLSSFSTHDYQEMSFLFWDCSNLKTINVSELWNSENNIYANGMFMGCQNLVGGKGTTYSSEHVDFAYARIDGAGGPGYFTEKNSTNIQVTMQGQRQDSDIFDLFGRKLTSPTKGVNIIGGKKTLVK